MNLSNKTFFITGGCSGLGKATALHLAEQNANIVLADIDIDVGQDIASLLGEQCIFIPVDVSDPEHTQSALNRANEHFEHLHGLINCAGILVAERVIKKDGSLFDLDHFCQCVNVNLIGSFNMLRLITPILINNHADENGERGVIINTASIAAYEGQIGQAAYSASKAGIIGMTLPVARELAQYGIRVITIAPGVFETPLLAEISAEKRQLLKDQIPFPSRLGYPSEYASLVQHIIENPMLNGEVIRLDGAMRLC